MNFSRMTARLAAMLVGMAICGGSVSAQPGAAPERSFGLSSTAERVFAAARPKLLQIRTVVMAAEGKASIGSGFFVTADGLAVTNYHVVSQYGLDPKTYRLEYTTANGVRGELKLLAIDVANDLAVVRAEQPSGPFFEFDDRALQGGLPNGERFYAMGYPLDIGFTIVEGTYNGLVERSYNDRIHFTAPINPGMSGGPTVTADGRIAGINVAKQIGADLVSFLVPARFAVALVDRALAGGLPSPKDLRVEIGRQLTLWQANLNKSLAEMGFRSATFGPYQAPETAAPWFTCWSQTNVGQVPKPRAAVSTTNCRSDTRLFIADDLFTGLIGMSHSYLRSIDLNQFQFAVFLSQQNQPSVTGGWSRKWHTNQRCHEEFLAASPVGDRPPMRAVWCARAYREFDGLYDVSVMTITQNSGTEALVSRLSLQGVTYENGMTQAKRFIDAIQWAK
jgi:serine protease Do